MSRLPPQVIRRGDEYVVHNVVGLDTMTSVQKIAVGMIIWDQVKTLMEINGEYKERDRHILSLVGIGSIEDIDKAAAKCLNISWSSLSHLRPRLRERPDVVKRMLDGEFERTQDVARFLGMRVIATLEEGRPSNVKNKNSYYGKGDKFPEATEPLLRYLMAWKKKGFRFPHVPPREAKRRLATIESIVADLTQVREDIVMRSHVATYAAPSERKADAR